MGVSSANPAIRSGARTGRNTGGCIGVDTNRNFDFLSDHLTKFAPDSRVRTSADPGDPEVYRGPSPASEPETQNVVWLLDSDPRIRWHVDVHRAVPIILHSWGSDQNQTTLTAQNFLNSAFDPVRGRVNDTAYREYISQSIWTSSPRSAPKSTRR
jgi:murein tripeptide amidase MpaA